MWTKRPGVVRAGGGGKITWGGEQKQSSLPFKITLKKSWFFFKGVQVVLGVPRCFRLPVSRRNDHTGPEQSVWGGFHKFFKKTLLSSWSFFKKSIVYDIFQNKLIDVLRKMGHNCINKVQLHEILQFCHSTYILRMLYVRYCIYCSTHTWAKTFLWKLWKN